MPENEVLKLSSAVNLINALKAASAQALLATGITEWSFEVDVKPAITGVDDTRGAYFTTEGLLQQIVEDSGVWVDAGDPIITERYFETSGIFDAILGVDDTTELFALTLPNGTLRRVTQDVTRANRGVWQADDSEPNGWKQELKQFVSVLDPDDETDGLNGKAVGDYATSKSDYKSERGVLYGKNSNFKGANDWIADLGAPTFDINTTVANALYIDFTSGNESLKIENILESAKTYTAYITHRLNSGTAAELVFGKFASSGAGRILITPSSTKTTTKETFTADSTYFAIGVLTGDNNGSAYEIHGVEIYEGDELIFSIQDRLDSIESYKVLDAVEQFGVVRGNNSTMTGANDWIADIGSPTFDINTTVAYALYIDFTTGNQSVKLDNILEDGQEYTVYITHRLNSGTGVALRCGLFSGTLGVSNFDIYPQSVLKTDKAVITASAPSLNFAIGVLSANNNGSVYEIHRVEIYKGVESILDIRNDIETVKISDNLNSFHTDQFLLSLSKYDKPLTKVAVLGDSLNANFYGGNIPVEFDETNTARPPRLIVNNLPRRIYDEIAFNRPTYRRLDNGNVWTLSGTWTAFLDTTVFEPIYSTSFEKYHKSVDTSAYIEIDIPDGQENFAIICQRDEGFGVLNVTLNGGSIAAYGATSIDLDRTRTGASDIGNPYHTELYTDLPAGVNTIRIAKEANTEEVRVWGVAHWSGNTIMVQNVAHGGHTMRNLLDNHLPAEVGDNDYDALIFQLTIMNEQGSSNTPDESINDFQELYETYLKGKDFIVTTCNPFGEDPVDNDPNYYTLYDDPVDMETMTLALKQFAYDNKMPFVDVFSLFKLKVENRGGTLTGGEAGLWYTSDGQHPNEVGAREWFNLIKFAFQNKPITFSD